MRVFVRSATLAICGVLLGANVQAAPLITGSQGLADLGTIGSDSGDLATATVFSNLEFFTTLSQSGNYVGFPITALFPPTATLDINNPAGFTFGSATFGTFTGATISGGTFDPTTRSRAFSVIGTFNPGTAFPTVPGINSAQLSISFTQNGGAGQPLSVSATLTTPAPSVPEPATIVMLGTLCGPLAIAYARRRKAQQTAV